MSFTPAGHSAVPSTPTFEPFPQHSVHFRGRTEELFTEDGRQSLPCSRTQPRAGDSKERETTSIPCADTGNTGPHSIAVGTSRSCACYHHTPGLASPTPNINLTLIAVLFPTKHKPHVCTCMCMHISR